MSDAATMVALGEDYPELRESVRKICERYPGAYWRKLEDEQAYPTEFVEELTQGGFLASLIPEEYGGSGLPLRAAAVILEEINALGLHRQPGPCADVHHGHAAAARQRGAEAALSARDRLGRIAPAGVRRDRADDRLRHDQAQDARGAQRQSTTSSTARRCGPRARGTPI